MSERIRRKVWGLAMCLALVSAAACSTDTTTPADSETPTVSQTPAPTEEPTERVEMLQPQDDAEEVVWQRRGSGRSKTIEVSSRGVVNVYAVCSAARAITVEITTARLDGHLDAPCDSVVTRRQVYSKPGGMVSVRVAASAVTAWQVLVTRR